MRSPSRSAVAILLLAGAGALGAPGARAADDPPKASPAATEMLSSMREKGLLSEEEYEDLYRRQALYEIKEREEAALPGWLRNWTFGGDMRVRWERIDVGNAPRGLNASESPSDGAVNTLNNRAFGTRDRGRMLLRVGAERRLGDQFTLGFRLATSSAESFGGDTPGNGTGIGVADGGFGQNFASDPRSMNTTFGDYFAPKQVFLDRAYLQFAPTAVRGLRMSFGKLANPYISSEFPADFLVWDNDLQLEGGTLQYGFDLVPELVRLDLSSSYSFIDEVGSVEVRPLNENEKDGPVEVVGPNFDDSDPYMYGYQGGLTFSPTPWLRFGGRAAYYDLRDLNASFAAAIEGLGNTGRAIGDNPLDVIDTQSKSTGAARGRLREQVFDVFTHLTYRDWGLVTFAQSTKLLGVGGPENRGYALGFHVNTPLRTRLTVLYARVGRDGVVSLFSDSDLFDGFTNAEGYYVALQHSVNANVSLRAAFFSSDVARENCARAPSLVATRTRACNTADGNDGLKNFRKAMQNRNRFQVDMRVAF